MARVEPRRREQHVALEAAPLGLRERDLDAVVRRAFGDQRLRREQRVHRELLPTALTHEVLLEQHVVDVMARVPLVACEIDGAIDVDREIGVDLNEAAVIALIPVVAAPALVGDVLDGEAFARRQRDVLERPAAARVDGRREDRIEAILRDDEARAELVVAIDHRSPSRQHPVELRQHLREIRLRVRRRHRVVQLLRLLVELQFRPHEHRHTCAQRFKLPRQVLMSKLRHLVGADRRLCGGNVPREHRSARRNLGERELLRFRIRPPFGGAVVGIHVVGVVLPDGEHEPHVPLGKLIHPDVLRAGRHEHRRREHRRDNNTVPHAAYLSRMVGIRYSSKARRKS